jgi:anti-sigma regulatory factor (Ser/Thr protein kinase)
MVYLEARDDLVATAAYQPVPAAAAAARRFVRDTLRSWELARHHGAPGEPAELTQRDTLVDDAVLLTSELVTNAVLHAGTPVQVTCRLLGDLSDGAVEIAVLDRLPTQLRPDRPHTAAEAAERTNGRGLQLPSELATAWGVTYARAAKAVWFRLDLAGRGRAAVPVPRPVSVPEQPAAQPTAKNPSDPDIPAPRAGEGPDVDRFDDLLVSTVESARDAIGADTAYLLHAADGGEPRARTADEGGEPLMRAAAAEGDRSAPGRAGLPASAARALAHGALSLVTVPLMVDGRVTGVLAAAAAEPGRFSESDASRLQDLADRSAPALERARLSAAWPA